MSLLTKCSLFFLVLLLSACTHSVTKFYPEIIPKKSEVTLPLSPQGNSTLNIVYMGCGQLTLEQNGDAILLDPFFSNQHLLKLLGRIKTKPELYRRWKSSYESFLPRSVVKAALVSHTHYDHVMDLPTFLQDHYFLQLKTVYGNSYLPKMLKHFDDLGVRLTALSDQEVYDPLHADPAYQWINVTPHIRFLPILSNHAPHTKHKLYMDKPLEEDYFDEHLVWANNKVKAFKWTTGTTYSFLVDFIEQDTLRVFIQTSASQHPYGFPPQAELKKKGVDLAIVCYASAMNVDDYPRDIVNQLAPKKMMLVHWEDFFRTPKSFNDQRLVRSTSPKKVRKRIDALERPAEFFMMPKPGTHISVKY